jgi:hypothetical protein
MAKSIRIDADGSRGRWEISTPIGTRYSTDLLTLYQRIGGIWVGAASVLFALLREARL